MIARPDIRSLEDLRGKRVDFGPPGTSTTLTTPLIFQRLGINVQEVKLPNPFTPAAYQRIAKGEADAAVRVSQKPLSHVAQIPPNSGLHLVPIPFNKVFADLYAIGEFTHEDYPNWFHREGVLIRLPCRSCWLRTIGRRTAIGTARSSASSSSCSRIGKSCGSRRSRPSGVTSISPRRSRVGAGFRLPKSSWQSLSAARHLLARISKRS